MKKRQLNNDSIRFNFISNWNQTVDVCRITQVFSQLRKRLRLVNPAERLRLKTDHVNKQRVFRGITGDEKRKTLELSKEKHFIRILQIILNECHQLLISV